MTGQPGPPDPWPGTPQYPAPMPPVQQQDGKKPVPADVITAFQLWFVVGALGIVYLVSALAFAYGDRDSFVDQVVDELAKQSDTVMSRADVEQLFVFAIIGTGVFLSIVLTGLLALFAFKMRKGKNWARMLLTMIGVFTVFSAIPTIFGITAGTGTAALIMGGAGILQAVAAIGAIVLMHRKESNEYFLNLPPAR
ncbi:hypothetical protein [Rhodococcus sp. BE178]|uniref:hypothetical protein n=1 Tax=Rhodococcus sp. BE178 TaxID=2817737 RepID=UPI003D1F16A6